MSSQQDQQIIDDLFDRIEEVARKSAPRDPDAEAQIQRRLGDFPPAPYYLAQTVVAQEQALRDAQTRIAELEGKQRARGPWDQAGEDRPSRGGQGGFLASAAQTALGVAGGMMLFNALGGLFGSAQAAEPDANAEADPAAEPDQPGDEFDSGGDDFGDGGFDIGGDF